MSTSPLLIKFTELEPSWAVKRAREPGFLRWLVSWMGGPPGTVNFNPAQAALSETAAVGFMAMPQGNRQAGLHIHSVAEIYVILKGEIEGYDHTGVAHRAGPSDCIYIPAGVPHGVRTVGSEDLHLIWVHDSIERLGVSVYLDDGQTGQTGQSDQHISIVSSTDRFRQADGNDRVWAAGYVGAVSGEIANPAITLGVKRLLSGGIDPVEPAAAGRLLIGIAGDTTVRCDGWTHKLSYLDGVHIPPGAGATLWNSGDAPSDLLCLVEGSNAL
jgi:mannose-6-phosphate isomerase-like protein (cupin superfamily)